MTTYTAMPKYRVIDSAGEANPIRLRRTMGGVDRSALDCRA